MKPGLVSLAGASQSELHINHSYEKNTSCTYDVCVCELVRSNTLSMCSSHNSVKIVNVDRMLTEL